MKKFFISLTAVLTLGACAQQLPEKVREPRAVQRASEYVEPSGAQRDAFYTQSQEARRVCISNTLAANPAADRTSVSQLCNCLYNYVGERGSVAELAAMGKLLTGRAIDLTPQEAFDAQTIGAWLEMDALPTCKTKAGFL